MCVLRAGIVVRNAPQLTRLHPEVHQELQHSPRARITDPRNHHEGFGLKRDAVGHGSTALLIQLANAHHPEIEC